MDNGRTVKPDADSPLYLVYLTLSAAPPAEWRSTFELKWMFEIYNQKRHLDIDGDAIVIRCIPEEIETHHLEHLKKVVEASNSEYSKYVENENRKEERRAQEKAAEEERLKAIKGRLKF